MKAEREFNGNVSNEKKNERENENARPVNRSKMGGIRESDRQVSLGRFVSWLDSASSLQFARQIALENTYTEV